MCVCKAEREPKKQYKENSLPEFYFLKFLLKTLHPHYTD